MTRTGEVRGAFCYEIHFIYFLSIALGFKYKIYASGFAEGVKSDFSLGSYPLYENAYHRASYPYHLTDVTFASEKPYHVTQAWAFLRPFSPNVWIGLLTSIFFIALMHFLIFRKRFHFMSVLFHVLATFLAKHRDWRPRSLAQRIMVLSGSIGATIIAFSYVSVLLSSSLFPARDKGITNFDELQSAIIEGEAKAVLIQGSNQDEVFIMTGDEQLVFFGRHMQKQSELKLDRFRETVKPNIVVVSTRMNLEIFLRKEDYFFSQDSLYLDMYVMYESIGIRFCCMEEVNKAIHWIWASGLRQKELDTIKHFGKVANLHRTVQDPVSPLNLFNMSGAFYVLITGHILALMCLLGEVYIHGYILNN